MSEKELRDVLSDLTKYFEDDKNDKLALVTYYSDFYASELVNELWNVLIDKNKPNEYSY